MLFAGGRRFVVSPAAPSVATPPSTPYAAASSATTITLLGKREVRATEAIRMAAAEAGNAITAARNEIGIVKQKLSYNDLMAELRGYKLSARESDALSDLGKAIDEIQSILSHDGSNIRAIGASARAIVRTADAVLAAFGETRQHSASHPDGAAAQRERFGDIILGYTCAAREASDTSVMVFEAITKAEFSIGRARAAYLLVRQLDRSLRDISALGRSCVSIAQAARREFDGPGDPFTLDGLAVQRITELAENLSQERTSLLAGLDALSLVPGAAERSERDVSTQTPEAICPPAAGADLASRLSHLAERSIPEENVRDSQSVRAHRKPRRHK